MSLLVCLGVGLFSSGCATTYHAHTLSIGTLREAAPRLDRAESATVIDTQGEEVEIVATQQIDGVVSYQREPIVLPISVRTLRELLHWCDFEDDACELRRVAFVNIASEERGWGGPTVGEVIMGAVTVAAVSTTTACVVGEIGCEHLGTEARAAIAVTTMMAPLLTVLLVKCSGGNACFGSAR